MKENVRTGVGAKDQFTLFCSDKANENFFVHIRPLNILFVHISPFHFVFFFWQVNICYIHTGPMAMIFVHIRLVNI